MKAAFRKPLVVMTPKSLLRHPLAVSRAGPAGRGHLPRRAGRPRGRRRRRQRCVLLQRQDLLRPAAAPPRAEAARTWPSCAWSSSTPSRRASCRLALDALQAGAESFWVQEEPENMGAWSFIRPRLEALLVGKPLTYIGRRESPTPATGFPHIYRREQAEIIDRAVGPKP
ncbi:MAG: hypothetical protein MZV70_71625 [Desulfobacterales bacterium]|nr:hypothetical protein [Desulfobacterales bacterium]